MNLLWQLLDGPVVEGDCLELLRELPDESIDAVVTDPPYGIGFMGHEWDQPGAHAPITRNGTPGEFKRVPRVGVPPGQRRDRQPAPSGYTKKLGARATDRDRGGAMEAGRYDLSLTANQRYQAWCEAWAREAFRVLKPGGHLLSSCGTRTYHRMAAGVEDAGFEIRDSIMWLYGSGFPKSLNVAVAIDKANGAPDRGRAIPTASTHLPTGRYAEEKLTANPVDAYEAQSTEAEAWSGWGTALKPAHEPIVVARKPLIGTVAGNVLAHGTGGINVDGCRIAHNEECRTLPDQHGDEPGNFYAQGGRHGETLELKPEGRWPANIVLSHSEDCVRVGERRIKAITGTAAGRMGPDYQSGVYGGYTGNDEEFGKPTGFGDADGMETVEAWECVDGCPVAELDRQSDNRRAGSPKTGLEPQAATFAGDVYGSPAKDGGGAWGGYGDDGGASRFFYCAKASRAERNAGLEKLPRHDSPLTTTPTSTIAKGRSGGARIDEHDYAPEPSANVHPTVKPIELMRWLVRLVTPPGGIVLDPFAGSGTTGCACALEGFDFVGVDRDPTYVAIARARIAWWAAHPEGVETDKLYAAERERAAVAASGQAGLF